MSATGGNLLQKTNALMEQERQEIEPTDIERHPMQTLESSVTAVPTPENLSGGSSSSNSPT